MRIIALGRLIYGIILLGAGLAIFDLIGKNLATEILKWIKRWHVDTHLYYVHWLLQKGSAVNHSLLVLLAFTNFFYAALAFVETGSLLLGKRWAWTLRTTAS